MLISAAVIGGAILCAYIVRLSETLAVTPWESAIGMEAMRLKAGLPLYEAGHATHLYGPLLSAVLAGIFWLTGFNLLGARIVFALLGLLLVALLVVILCRGELRRSRAIAALLFLALNLRTNFVFLTAQPDCLAALLALAGLVLWITRRQSIAWAMVSLALFLLAMYIKQTSAAFALIPLAHAVLWERQRTLATAWSALPPAILLLSLALTWFVHPALFDGMVLIPGALKVHYAHAVSMSVYLLATFPILFVALVVLLTGKDHLDARERWICSSLSVLVPIGIWTVIKSGGGLNSLLFAYLAMTALVVSQFARIEHWMRSAGGWRAFGASILVAVALLCSFFFQMEKSMAVLLGRSGDDKYDAAVQVARQLGSGVITPEDPTIAFRANGFFGRALYFELDTHSIAGEWPSSLPAGMQSELDQSRFVLTVDTGVPSPLTPETLAKNRFRLLSVPQLRDSAYALWAKAD